ncbi:unnamed protein product [Rhizophagus irregularis]|nr:unnamed protein product [Rhizophagus irregularis]
MIDVVHSVNLDQQRLDFPHDQYFPNNTPATIATTTPVQASFGFDLPDQDININNSPQSNVTTSQQQNSRQYNDMTATAFSNQHQYSHDSSVQQTSILPSPPFVEPSGNYIAISSATNSTQTLPYVPLYDPSTIFTAKPTPTSTPTPTPISTTISISQNSTTTSESTSIKQTYSYSGPPKSYYSRLPLYDRPFKCDQCPQRPRPQAAQKDPFGRKTLSWPIL